MPGTECVKVVVRVRPLNGDEKGRGCATVVQVDQRLAEVTVVHPKTQVGTAFSFNSVFGPDSGQQELYDQTVFPLVESVLEGYNGTIFAYGQTGCGKTFTMSGETDSPGVIPNSFKHIFGAISDTDKSKCFLVRCSYMEIYNEEIRDLLHYELKSKLELKEGKEQCVFVKGLTTETVSSVADMTQIMDIGAKHRTTKETMMNERSSRSHAIFTVYLEMSEEIEGRQVIKAGKLNLVDLAGSERQRKTQAQGDRLREAIEINLSLSALGNVISALVDGSSSHIPYRDSKLTRLLQDSLGGNTKTIMIAVASPADYNIEESLSTLRYASRAKRIQNKPKVNEDPKDALLREYAEEIAKLKRMLAERGTGEPVVIEKIVEREKIVEKHVLVAGNNPQKSRNTVTETRKKTKAEGLDDDSSEEEEPSPPVRPSGPKGRTHSKAQIIEDDSSGGEHGQSPPSRVTPVPAKSHLGAANTQRTIMRDDSITAKQSEDEYEQDGFEEDSPTVSRQQEPAGRLLQKSEAKAVARQSPVLTSKQNSIRRPSSKEAMNDGPWLRPSAEPEERKLVSKRTASNDPRPSKGADIVIRSTRSPAVRKPVKGVVDEEPKPPRSQKRHPSTVNIEIAEVDETSEGEEFHSPQMDVLSFIKEKLITGGQLIEETDQERLKEYHRLQLQLQTQKDREAALKETQQRQEEDLLLKEKQYQNLSEEVEEQRKVIKALRSKYKASLAEIEDLNHEREVEKGDMLDSIRAKDRELAFYYKLTDCLLAPGEVVVVKQKSKYDEDNRDWVIPPFVVQQNKQTVFPKLQKRQAQELMEKDLKSRAVVWSTDAVDETSEELADDTLKKYQWLNRAEARPLEIDNRPPTSGHRSRQLMSRHSKNVLLEPIPGEKTVPCNTFPTGTDPPSHITPLSKKRTLKPHPLDPSARIVKKTSDIS